MRDARALKDAPAKRLKIGEVAKRSGVGIEALRFYERQGLLGRPARTESGYRLYDESVLEQLDFIRRAQALGFSLAEIARITAERRAGHSPCAEVRAIVGRRLTELDERLDEMRRYRDDLAKVFAAWEERGDASGIVCGLIEDATLEHAVDGPGIAKRRKQ